MASTHAHVAREACRVPGKFKPRERGARRASAPAERDTTARAVRAIPNNKARHRALTQTKPVSPTS